MFSARYLLSRREEEEEEDEEDEEGEEAEACLVLSEMARRCRTPFRSCPQRPPKNIYIPSSSSSSGYFADESVFSRLLSFSIIIPMKLAFLLSSRTRKVLRETPGASLSGALAARSMKELEEATIVPVAGYPDQGALSRAASPRSRYSHTLWGGPRLCFSFLSFSLPSLPSPKGPSSRRKRGVSRSPPQQS